MDLVNSLIAVVDDEVAVRTMLGRVLRLANYQVAAFASGEAFLSSLHVQRPVCVILDWHMPGLTGPDVHRRMQAQAIAVPVIYITASDDIALDHVVGDAADARLLRKPFSTDQLLDAISAALIAGSGER